MIRSGAIALCLVTAGLAHAAVAAPSAPSGADAVQKSSNVKLIENFPFDYGGELAALGDFVYAGESDGRGATPGEGGIHILDVAAEEPFEAGFLECPGSDNDVEVIRKHIVALGFASNQCAPGAGNGFIIVDVKDPKRPKILSEIQTAKNHTFKPLPGGKYVYTAGGGAAGGPAAGPVIVDVRNPRKPEVVARPKTITMDCHDISFSIVGENKLGFCAGAIGTGEVQIWDVSDPIAPTTIGRIYNPMIQYSHYAIASPDGKLLAIDDEAFVAHDCNTHQTPTGRVWVYDITTPEAPLPQGSFAAPRGGDGQTNIGTVAGWVPSWCLSHGLDWQPDSRNLAVTWFTGGVSVLNWDTPTAPTEEAFFQAENSETYSALWHNGFLFTNDYLRGVDMFKIKGLPKG